MLCSAEPFPVYLTQFDLGVLADTFPQSPPGTILLTVSRRTALLYLVGHTETLEEPIFFMLLAVFLPLFCYLDVFFMLSIVFLPLP